MAVGTAPAASEPRDTAAPSAGEDAEEAPSLPANPFLAMFGLQASDVAVAAGASRPAWSGFLHGNRVVLRGPDVPAHLQGIKATFCYNEGDQAVVNLVGGKCLKFALASLQHDWF